MDNVHIVTGMQAIINPDNIRPGMTSADLENLEKQLIDGGVIASNGRVRDAQDKFHDEMVEAAKKFGVSFGDIAPKPATPAPSYTHTVPTSSPTAYPATTYEEDDDTEDDADSGEDVGSTYGNDGAYSTYGNIAQPNIYGAPPPNDYAASASSTSRFGGDRPRFGEASSGYASATVTTNEQQRAAHIDRVVGEGLGFNLDQERKEDLKCAMLAEIDILMEVLGEADVDLSRVPAVDRKSVYEEVDTVLKMLRHKSDHVRYCGFADEFLLFGAYALEEMFDGKRVYFGKYNPDLTGWHNQLNVKLKRMRTDTSQIVSSVMHDYNISPGIRILLELIPSMFMYSKMRSQQHGQPGLFSDESMHDETANLGRL